MEEFDDVCMQVDSCALSGVAAFFGGIANAVVVINSPLWCYFNVLKQFQNQQDEHERIFCTNLDNNALVYGTENDLTDTLGMIKRKYKNDISVLCIENNCAVTLIGDDIEAIAKSAGFNCPIISLDSGGLQGDFWEGYTLAAKEYFNQISLNKNLPKIKKTVNLLGGSIATNNCTNDIRELKSLLEFVGYRVIACPGIDTSNENMKNILQAELNIVINEGLGLELAGLLQRQYDIPYINLPLPYGITGTEKWLKNILSWFNDKSKNPDIDKLVARYRHQTDLGLRKFRNMWGELQFSHVIVAGSVSMAVPLLETIKNEWADCFEVHAILHDGLINSKLISNHSVIINGKIASRKIKEILNSMSEGLLVASSNEHAVLMQAGIRDFVYQNISIPNNEEANLLGKPYVGFRGAMVLLELIWNKFIVMHQQRSLN